MLGAVSNSSSHVKNSNQAGGGCLVLFGLVFAGFGLLFIFVIFGQAMKEAKAYLWEETPCKIESCEIKTQQGREGGAFQLQVNYQYKFKGNSFISSNYTLQEHWSNDYEKLALKRKELLHSAEVTCYVDPDNPANAVIKREGVGTGLMMLFPLIFVAIGGAIVWGGVVSLRNKKAEKDGRVQSISSRGSSSNLTAWKFKLIFGALFALIGGGVAIPLGVIPAMKMSSSRSWQETPCKILWSRVQRHESTSDGKTSITYSIDIFYEYKFRDNTYRSNKYAVFGGSSGGRAGKREVAKRYPRGSQQVCYVNPDIPEMALIKRGFSLSLLFALIPLVFLLIGISMLRSGLRSSGSRSGRAMGAGSSEGRSFADAYRSGARGGMESAAPQRSSVLGDRSLQQGISGEAKVLSPGKKRLGGALVILMVALFWNGIVSVFLVQAVKGFQSGKGEWFMALFLVPFVLVGLVMIAVFLYQLLSLTNPKPVITLRPGIFQPGKTSEIAWKVSSNAERIQHFKIVLWGVESATYRRGTKTHTSREVFYVHSLFESTMHSDIRSGTVQFELPVDVVPTLSTGNNAIEWELRVEGDIPRWPDIQDKYVVEVRGGGIRN
ncbi:MAG: DUF3592 domain-containing protein [Verrucomicrobiales bacterium]|nr:DUF3592 domain-containing protein [Verrucomicrobiales bacterium]